jgi:hypothetical protein
MNMDTPGTDVEDVRIGRWLDDRSGRLPTTDREAVLRRTLQRVPLEPQRPRRWRFVGAGRSRGRAADKASLPGSGTGPDTAIPRPASTATTMALRSHRPVVLASMLAALALLALVPTLHRGLAPAASPMAYPGPGAATSFTGTMSVLGPPTVGETQVVGDLGSGNGVVLRRGATDQAMLYSSDPRFSGALTIEFNDERYGLEDARSEAPADVGTIWGTHRLTNDDGAWTGSFIGAGTSIGPYSQKATVTAVYEGQDAYEGLTAIVVFDLGNDTFTGIIVPADLAPPSDLTPPSS